MSADVAKSLPRLQASGARLKQVLTNLLNNAIKFTPEKGEVKLTVTDQAGDIRVEAMDTGVGITADDLPKIFTEFYRGGNREKGGTGLGLSIAKRIVEAHGGKIWAESPNPEDKAGRGSKFTFTLPRSRALAGKKEGKKNLTKGKP